MATKFVVQVENTLRDRDGNPVSRRFIAYSGQTSRAMADLLARSLQRIDRSYRIVDELGAVVDQWLRADFQVDE